MELKITEDTNLEKLYTGNDPFIYTDFGGSYYSGAYVDWLIDINKSLLVRYETDVLGKPVYLGELDGTPRWVVVDGETVCRSTDEYLKSYITNPVKSLWRILEGKVANDAISVPVTEWLQRLKETNKADA